MRAHMTLTKLRKQAGLSQSDVAERLTHSGYPVTNRAVSKWERGDTQPNMEQFLHLLALYDVRDAITVFGLGKSDRLNDRGRARLKEYAGLLALDERFTARAAERTSRVLPLYDLPVSAGTGQFLDGEHYEPFEADDTVPAHADFAVRIKGDSMLPRFLDGQIVFVEKRTSLEKGEFGVFVLNGEAFCKKFGGETETELISLNPKYAPIPVRENDELHVIGKVLS